ncbi:MAG: 2-keto-4-pentenoate hydratase [Aquabacterium sp.]
MSHARRSLITTALIGAALLAACTTAPPEPAGCPDDAVIADMTRHYLARTPVPNPAPLSMEAGRCGAANLVKALGASQGTVVGWKAGLTNPAVQQRFGHNAPIRGTLFSRMMLRDGAEVPAAFGARPFAEADLVVEVSSSAIHDARTPLEVLRHLKSVVPFIELPDTMVQDPTKVSGPLIALVNVGARLGVLGSPIPVQDSAAFGDALRDMTVRAVDGTGRELAKAPGAAILGHPLNAVIWLAADLKRDGITLKAGDLLSLGSFSPPLPVAAGQSITVVYDGLPGQPSVSARFR